MVYSPKTKSLSIGAPLIRASLATGGRLTIGRLTSSTPHTKFWCVDVLARLT